MQDNTLLDMAQVRYTQARQEAKAAAERLYERFHALATPEELRMARLAPRNRAERAARLDLARRLLRDDAELAAAWFDCIEAIGRQHALKRVADKGVIDFDVWGDLFDSQGKSK